MATRTTLRKSVAATAASSDTRPRRSRYRYRGRDQVAGYLFLSPWILGLLLLTLGPMLASLYLSFTDYDLFTSPGWVGLDNYVELFSDPRYRQSVQVTLTYVVVSVPVKLAVALGLALLLNSARRGQGFYRSACYAPSLLGASVSIAIVWRAIFSDDAVVDRALGAVGLDTGGWIGNPDYALWLLVLLAVWQFGAPMVIFLAGLRQVPRELHEAAAVDGASRRRRFTAITLPMLSPVIFFNLLLETINAFQIFTSAFVVSSGAGGAGGPAGSTLVYTIYLYQRGFQDLRMGYASAMAWVLLLVVGLVTLVLFRTARAWVYYAGDDR